MMKKGGMFYAAPLPTIHLECLESKEFHLEHPTHPPLVGRGKYAHF